MWKPKLLAKIKYHDEELDRITDALYSEDPANSRNARIDLSKLREDLTIQRNILYSKRIWAITSSTVYSILLGIIIGILWADLLVIVLCPIVFAFCAIFCRKLFYEEAIKDYDDLIDDTYEWERDQDKWKRKSPEEKKLSKDQTRIIGLYLAWSIQLKKQMQRDPSREEILQHLEKWVDETEGDKDYLSELFKQVRSFLKKPLGEE